MNDTSPDVEKRYRDMIMALTPQERLAMGSRMHGTARTLLLAAIKREMPHLNDAQLRGQLFLRMYRQDFSADVIRKIAERLPNMEV